MNKIKQANYKIELHFYVGKGKWCIRNFEHSTLKGAFYRAREIQRDFNGILYYFYLLELPTYKTKWTYQGLTEDGKYCNRLMLRENNFKAIYPYTSIRQGA